MDHDDFIVAEDRLEKTLLKADYVSLLKIPPPKEDANDDELNVADMSDWDMNGVVWTGRLKFMETEFIMNMDIHNLQERQIIQAVYSVILEHEDKKIGFGLIFKDSSKANEFNIALQNYRKDAKAALETHDDFVNDLEEGVKNLKLDHSPSEVRTDELSPDDDAHKTTQHDTEESDLEFGDFVTSAD